MVKKYMSGHPR